MLKKNVRITAIIHHTFGDVMTWKAAKKRVIFSNLSNLIPLIPFTIFALLVPAVKVGVDTKT